MLNLTIIVLFYFICRHVRNRLFFVPSLTDWNCWRNSARVSSAETVTKIRDTRTYSYVCCSYRKAQKETSKSFLKVHLEISSKLWDDDSNTEIILNLWSKANSRIEQPWTTPFSLLYFGRRTHGRQQRALRSRTNTRSTVTCGPVSSQQVSWATPSCPWSR